MSAWLDALEPSGLRAWLRHTAVPMLATLPDGKFLWVNSAYERLTGYTWSELNDLSWTELTESLSDRNKDVEMALELQSGQGRISYQFRKQYKHKTGTGPRVIIDVLRYPIQGDFVCFLVSVIPLDKGYEQALHEVEKLHRLIEDFIQLQKRTLWDQYWNWAEKHPYRAAIVTVIAATFILGDRILQIVKDALELFGWEQPPTP